MNTGKNNKNYVVLTHIIMLYLHMHAFEMGGYFFILLVSNFFYHYMIILPFFL
jgi:hypothetical protein